jgi:integrase
MAARRRDFGSVRRLPSGRWQARYRGPDGKSYTARTADGRAMTFSTKAAASAYLTRVSADVQRGQWVSPDAPRPDAPPTLAAYAATFMATRELSVTTRQHYAQVLRDHILPRFGAVLVGDITPAAVRAWYAGLRTGPVQRSHCYGLLRTVLNSAVADDVIAANPCRVRGGGQARRTSKTELPTLAELAVIVEHTPARFRLMVELAAWCGLRLGELAELRRKDIDVAAGKVKVRRGVVRVPGGKLAQRPKSAAGVRDVAIPESLLPALREHLREYVPVGPDALLFAGKHGGQLAPSSKARWYYPARHAAGRDDLRFHDLRHFAGTMSQVAGATLRETMARLGHSTVTAALRYQSAAADRDKAVAALLSELRTAPVVPIETARQPAG